MNYPSCPSSNTGLSEAPVLLVERLRVEFPNRELRQQVKVAVKDLTFQVRPGEVFGFLGPNGAGKTKTMNVLLGFTRATSGNAYLLAQTSESRLHASASAICRK